MSETPTLQDRSIGWGFIGTGSISATVAEQMAETGGGRLAAVWGHRPDGAEAFARQFGGATVCEDQRELVRNPQVDAVYIALPHSLHLDAIVDALDAGKHVLCEKPLGMTAAEVQQVLAHPRAAKVAIGEGFMVRHHPQWTWITDRISAGELGTIRSVQMHSCLNLPPPQSDRGLPGNGSFILDIGCYSVHLARAIFAARPQQVRSRMAFDEAGVRDTGFTVDLEFATGSAQIFASANVSPARRVHILGDAGSIEAFNPIHPAPDGTATVRLTTAEGSSEKIFPRAPQYGLQMAEFQRAVLAGTQPLVTLADAYDNAATIDAIRQSDADGGSPVAVAEPA